MQKSIFYGFFFIFSLSSFISPKQNNKFPNFPAYDASLTFDVGSCSCSGMFVTCSQNCDGSNCSCTCNVFTCSCSACERLKKPIANNTPVSIDEEQYKNLATLTSILKGEESLNSYLLLKGMVEDLKEKSYEKYHQKAGELETSLKKLPADIKVSVNNFFINIKSEFRI